MSESFWGAIPAAASIATPNSILTEQGNLLKAATKGALVGQTLKKTSNGGFQIDFHIRAEALNNYKYYMFKVLHGVDLYPLAILPNNETRIDCKTEADFKAELRKILSSESTRKIIEALLAQIRDDSEEIPF
jgi:hypothetical protein